MGSFPRNVTERMIFHDSIIYSGSRSLKCLIHIASYTLKIGVSVIELLGSDFLISNTFLLRVLTLVDLCLYTLL